MNQRRLWNDPKVRAERSVAVEKITGKPMELDPIADEPTPASDVNVVTYDRRHYDAVLAVFDRRVERSGRAAAMQEAMEYHDRERDRITSPRRKAEERREELRA